MRNPLRDTGSIKHAIDAQDHKASVKLATAAALPACSYTSGVLTADVNGALTVDGVAVAVGDRILVKNQVAGLQDGIYVVIATGGISALFVLRRAGDANANAEVTGGMFVWVEAGTANADTGWLLTTNNPITLGSTALTFTKVDQSVATATAYVDAGDAATLAAAAAADLVAINTRDMKASVKLATTAALPANSYASGVLTADSNGALTVDGVAVAVADRILVKDESAGANNGIYVVTATGAVGAKYVLTRAADADASSEVTAGMLVWVIAGTQWSATAWLLTTADPITLGSTSLTFTMVNSGGRTRHLESFLKFAIAANLAETVCPRGDNATGAAVARLYFLKAGCFLGYVIQSAVAITQGSATLKLRKNGSAFDTITLNSTNINAAPTTVIGTYTRNQYTFAAGDYLDVTLATTSDLLPAGTGNMRFDVSLER